MLETISKCPICGSQNQTHQLDAKDQLVSGETFSIQHCDNCNFQFTSPRPIQNNIINYYKSDRYISHSNKSNSLINIIYKLVRKFTLYKKLKMINRFSTQGSLLDYGCGTGHLIDYVQSKGWAVAGIEPDPAARKLVSKKILQENIFESLDQVGNKQFNVITLFHVLEHVHDLNKTLSKLVEITSDQGVIFVAVPNHMSYDAIKYKSDWAAYDLPRHLYHFDSHSISLLANKVGLNVVAQLPMHFDSYYVSLLSEKNRKNRFYLLKGFYSGLISNMKASKNKEYSSLIYVLQKK